MLRTLVDAQLAALHLAQIHDGRRPDARRLFQWERRIRVWAHRHPGKITRYPRVGQRTQYDLAELEEFARDSLGVAA